MLSALQHAPNPFPYYFTAPLPAPRNSSSARACDRSRSHMAVSSVRIAVVGDVHDQWDLEEDTKALHFLKPDLVLFTGDFGDENVELVRSVAKLEFAKAVILGNHDSWFTQQFSKKKDSVQLQLECLGEEHVAYKRLDFPQLKLSVVGGRPFSCGGEKLFRKKLLSAGFGVEDIDQSARRICKAAVGAPEDHLVILLAHNGPTGFGSNIDDICGKDWVSGGGDHGDPDLTKAISELKENAKFCIPLVVFGHMHKELAHGKGVRKMIVVGDDGIIYLNGAIVPRIRSSTSELTGNTSNNSNEASHSGTGSTRAYTTVDISEGRVTKIAECWVSVVGEATKLQEEHILLSVA
ncbi:uncharacterized protein LOC115752602 isoform X2 [Rhodamnia argentea]|uniref:Uncharacterized protein LOC115752602 isoform X2 n=1 Tax=Rhodamnia argentea TaxID=178133 RepID=A0ABM3HCK1_9MYRT|nr:uncharacterized protein LOC115752602 isoform X2 [Rhodamnia argentea]